MFDVPKSIPNLNPELVEQIESELGMSLDWEAGIDGNYKSDSGDVFSPVDLLDYIYAKLHSPSYREKYKEFLKIDFPRVPFNVPQEEFWRLSKLGGQLRQLHLMEEITSSDLTTKYSVEGDNVVEKPSRVGQKVFINDTQYFENVSDTAWEFYIGGYQPAQKWLKDRKGRELSFDDIIHYQKIIFILNQTDELMKQIDNK